MTDQNNDFKDNFVDSLLHSLYETDKDQARSLVDNGMQRLDKREEVSEVQIKIDRSKDA